MKMIIAIVISIFSGVIASPPMSKDFCALPNLPDAKLPIVQRVSDLTVDITGSKFTGSPNTPGTSTIIPDVPYDKNEPSYLYKAITVDTTRTQGVPYIEDSSFTGEKLTYILHKIAFQPCRPPYAVHTAIIVTASFTMERCVKYVSVEIHPNFSTYEKIKITLRDAKTNEKLKRYVEHVDFTETAEHDIEWIEDALQTGGIIKSDLYNLVYQETYTSFKRLYLSEDDITNLLQKAGLYGASVEKQCTKIL